MSEIDMLKLRLENAINGHEIAIACFYNEDTARMLDLLKDCYEVMCRIVAREDDLK